MPPSDLTAPCTVPAPTGDTLGYLGLEYTVDLQQALAQCSDRMAALRAWVKGERHE